MSAQGRIRLGAVGYLNARPLVCGLDRSPRFALRYDVPSQCAALLHEGGIDLGLIPSIEYLRGGPYCIVPDLAIASRGAVASVAVYTTKPMREVRSIAMDTSSRTSVALVRVLCERLYKIAPAIEARGPDLAEMLARSDAALIIGDNALFLDEKRVRLKSDTTEIATAVANGVSDRSVRLQPYMQEGVGKIDLGEVWTTMTGLPFVYAFWAGRPDALSAADVLELQRARDEGVTRPADLARAYLPDRPDRHEAATRYLRDNIKYHLGDEERAGLELFYRYAAEAGVVEHAAPLRFYGPPT
ncbi:MAG TPA: menaquinone biosynthesis protein [Vicinamibacterales bacterium]|nr:menaquinone biosynthesis protein [Vicinamibacterales bacterium]